MQLKCMTCGKTVSNEIPEHNNSTKTDSGLVLRCLIQCPECYAKEHEEELNLNKDTEQEYDNQNRYPIKNAEKKIFKILNNFKFNKVHKYMVDTNWQWATEFDEMIVPSVKRLSAHAQDLLERVASSKRDVQYVSTGGFKAMKMYEVLSLEFMIAEWDEENREDE